MRILVAADGECSLTRETFKARIGSIDKIIVADGALRHIDSLALVPDYIVGDLDSVDNKLLTKYKSAHIEKYPSDKDKTDLEIAVEKALSFSPSELIFIGMFGGRIDHQFGNVLLLTKISVVKISIEDNKISGFILNNKNSIILNHSKNFSLIPLSKEVAGVTVTGARWNLKNKILTLGSPTALCNEFIDNEVKIKIESGSLLVIQNLF